jgi:MFS family permease
VWWHLLFASGAQGIGFALLGTAQSCVVADVTRGYRREKGYSLTMSFSMVFSVMGTVVLIIYTYLYENILPGGIFNQLPLLVSAILSLIAAIPMFLIKIPSAPQEAESCSPEPRKDGESHIPRRSSTKDDQPVYIPPARFRSNSVVPKMIAFQAIIGFGAGFLVPLFNYYWKDIFGLDKYIIYTIALLGELGIAAGGLAAPWIAKRATKLGGRVGTTVACQFASIACAVFIGIVAYDLAILPTASIVLAAQALFVPTVIAFIARQALMNMVNPLISAVTMDHTPETKRGRVNSLTSFAFTVPNGVSPNLSVPLIASYGYASSASVLVVTYIIGTAMLSTTRKKDRLLVMQSRPPEK